MTILISLDVVQTITLATEEPPAKTDVMASGWGKPSASASGVSPVLREVVVPIADKSVCELAYPTANFDTKICISALGGHGTCNVSN